jgi:hypothetical protein
MRGPSALKSVLIAAGSMVLAFQYAGTSSTLVWNYQTAGSVLTKGPSLDSLLTNGKMGWNCCADCYVDMMCLTMVSNGAVATNDSVDLKCGLSTFSAKVGWNTGCKMTVHLDDQNAPALCTLSIPADTAHNAVAYSTTINPRVGSGTHSLYVKYSGSGYIGSFYWLKFGYGCGREASSATNWLPAVRPPANGDTVDFSGVVAGGADTIVWDLDIRPSYMNLDASRNVVLRLDSLQGMGIDTFYAGKINMRQGHIKAPAAMVIVADEVDTNGVALAQGEYASFSCRFGLATILSFGGGGKLIVGPPAGVVRDLHRGYFSPRIAFRMLDNLVIIGTGATVASRIDLFDTRGVSIRRSMAANSISTVNLPNGAYILRAFVANGHAARWKLCIKR